MTNIIARLLWIVSLIIMQNIFISRGILKAKGDIMTSCIEEQLEWAKEQKKLKPCDEEIVKLIECALADVDAHSYSFTENSEYYLGLTINQLKWLREKLTKQSSV